MAEKPLWEVLIRYFEALLKLEPGDELFRAWGSAIDRANETYVRSYAAKQKDTSDEAAKAQFKYFIENIEPRANEIDKILRHRVLESNFDDPAYTRIIDKFRHEAAISESLDPEALRALSVGENELRVRLNAQRVEVGGQSLTQSQAAVLRARTVDRREREAIWRQIKASQRVDDDFIGEHFLALVRQRHEVAKAAGYANYRDYIWVQKGRVDYTPEDVFGWLETYEEVFSSSYAELAKQRTEMLGIERHYPWDASVYPKDDMLGLTQEDYLAAGKRVFNEVSPDFVHFIEDMESYDLVDLMTRPNKAPMNFAGILKASQKSLIVCDCHGRVRDIGALFHEGGHALHNYSFVQNKLTWQKECSYEVMETMAYIMTLLGHVHIDALQLFDAELLTQFRTYRLEMILRSLGERSAFEHFQHAIYTQVDKIKSPEDLGSFYSPGLSYNDTAHFEEGLRHSWQVSQVLIWPFYNIEYFIAWMAALIYLENYLNDPKVAVQNLQQAMGYGGTRGVKETLATLGVNFPFSQRDITEARRGFDKLSA